MGHPLESVISFLFMKDLTQGPITKHILQLAIFLAVSMVFQTLYYLVDLYFVSRIGKEAIAGVGLAGNLMFVTLALTQMLGVGTATLISHAAGRKDQARAQLVFNQSFVFSMLVGLAVVVLGYLCRGPYTRWLSADDLTTKAGADYLLWFVPAIGLQFALISMASALRARIRRSLADRAPRFHRQLRRGEGLDQPRGRYVGGPSGPQGTTDRRLAHAPSTGSARRRPGYLYCSGFWSAAADRVFHQAGKLRFV